MRSDRDGFRSVDWLIPPTFVKSKAVFEERCVLFTSVNSISLHRDVQGNEIVATIGAWRKSASALSRILYIVGGCSHPILSVHSPWDLVSLQHLLQVDLWRLYMDCFWRMGDVAN